MKMTQLSDEEISHRTMFIWLEHPNMTDLCVAVWRKCEETHAEEIEDVQNSPLALLKAIMDKVQIGDTIEPAIADYAKALEGQNAQLRDKIADLYIALKESKGEIASDREEWRTKALGLETSLREINGRLLTLFTEHFSNARVIAGNYLTLVKEIDELRKEINV